MRQLVAPVLRSSKPISPWPIPPCWPRNESDRSAARHGGGPRRRRSRWSCVAVVVVGAVPVVLDVLVVVLGPVVAAVPAASAGGRGGSSRRRSSRTRRSSASTAVGASAFFSTVVRAWSARLLRLALRRQARATIPDATMDRSEELRQTPPSPAAARSAGWSAGCRSGSRSSSWPARSRSSSRSPSRSRSGPNWLLPTLEGALLIGLVIVSPHPNVRHSPLRRHVAIGMIGLVSAANIVSLVLLCHRLLHGGKENGHAADPVRDRAVVHERAAVRTLVLGGRPRRPGGARPGRAGHARLPVRADDRSRIGRRRTGGPG